MGNDRTVSAPDSDPDLLAIRHLIEDVENSVAPEPVLQNEPVPRRMLRKSEMLPPIPPAEMEAATPRKARSRVNPLKDRMTISGKWAWGHLKSYRPQRKSILLTSAVLLLILQPRFVLGWLAFAVVLLLACYLLLGADAFWRKAVGLFAVIERYQPKAARRWKLRAYAFSKRWDRHLKKLPDPIADKLRLPDLRGLLAADDRHQAVLDARLSRLNSDVMG
jgi:hypothetical protein